MYNMRTKKNKYDRPILPVNFKSLIDQKYTVTEGSRTVSGYLSIFNVVDSDSDMIIKGAFAKSITERGPDSDTHRKIAFLWQHDMKQPLGKMTVLKEDNIGLYFEAKLDDIPEADRALTQLLSGTLDNFSIGFQYVWDKMEYDEEMEAFICKEINLFEGSVVTLGANEYTFFDGMKSSTMKDAKQKLLRETEVFIKSLPAAQQYECRQIIMKNAQMALAKAATVPQDPEENEDDTQEDTDQNLEFIHKCLPVHAKGLEMIDAYQGAVDNDELQDCMKSMQDVHTDCMSKMLDIKADIKGTEKSLPEPRRKHSQEPVTELKKLLNETNFFTS
jgi:HK97 family phage prohead protease